MHEMKQWNGYIRIAIHVFSLEILKGGVKFSGNGKLCNVETIQWFDIVNTEDEHKPSLELPVAGNNPNCKCSQFQHWKN